jgi:hypothetical protein
VLARDPVISGTLRGVMSGATGDTEGFHVVVAEDGSLPTSELARLGVGPGEHLRLVPEQRRVFGRRSAGMLAKTVSAQAVEALVRGLDEQKAERSAYYRDASAQR